jgi:hypothetical protein
MLRKLLCLLQCHGWELYQQHWDKDELPMLWHEEYECRRCGKHKNVY